MLHYLYSLIIILLATQLTGQTLTSSLLTSSGGSYHQGSLNLTYSLGEVMTEGYSTTAKLTQGLLQGQLLFTPIFESPDHELSFKIYPNPFAEKLIFEKETNQHLTFELFNMHGQLIQRVISDKPSMEVNLAGLPSQLFVAKIGNLQTGQMIRSYRIFKSQ